MTKRKGNAPCQGRQPTIAPRGQVTKITARVSEQQRAEYLRRGGSKALRDWLDGVTPADTQPRKDYRMLAHGELIQVGDERVWLGEWVKATEQMIGEKYLFATHAPHRREVK